MADREGIKTDTQKCPVCKTAINLNKFQPFCSSRCADIDLGRWLTGCYAVPTDEKPKDPAHIDD